MLLCTRHKRLDMIMCVQLLLNFNFHEADQLDDRAQSAHLFIIIIW